MPDELSLHATYPFFDGARQMYDGFDVDALRPEPVRNRAVRRVVTALTDDPEENPDLGRGETDTADEMLAYPLARILVSIIDQETVTEQYAEAEARAAVARLRRDAEESEHPLSVLDACAELGVDVVDVELAELFTETGLFRGWEDLSTDERIRRMEAAVMEFAKADDAGLSPDRVEGDLEALLDGKVGWYIGRTLGQTQFYAITPPDYLSYAPLHRGNGWSLAQRSLYEGRVLVREEELFELLENAIHAKITENYPPEINSTLVETFGEDAGAVLTELPTEMTDMVDVQAFPLLDAETLPRTYALGWEDYEQYAPIGADETDVDIDRIREHYAQAEPVYEALGTINGLHTGWLSSHNGWYVYETLTDRSDHEQAWDEGFTQVQRPSLLPDDFDPSEAGRSVYTTNSYSPKAVYRKRPFKYEDNERVWMDEALEDLEKIDPLPGYGELGAYSLLVDIDLEDEWKQRPLPDEYRAVVEQRLRAWVNVFSKFVGGDPDDVFVIDSGGGAYVMTPPAITKRIAEEFDEEVEIDTDTEESNDDEADEEEEPDVINEIAHINEEIRDRMRTLTSAVDEVITGLDDAPDELFSADSVQNKNRQWKTLLSVHSSLDVLVHPLESDPEELSYEPLPFNDVGEDDYAAAEEWAEQFTSQGYDSEEYLEALVETLFTSEVFDQIESYHDVYEGEDWREILNAFLEERKERVDQRVDPYVPGDADGSIGDVGVTTSRREVVAAINNADLKSYVKQHHAQRWDTDNRSDGTTSFSPKTWRKPSPDANSCFYGPGEGAGTKPIVFDRKEAFSADILDLVAYDANLISHPSEKPQGQDWWRAVDLLREQGADIPVCLPDIEDDSNNYDRLSAEHIAEAALALDIASEEDVETRDGEYGEYTKLTDPELHDKTLEYLEERGIKHARDRITK